MYVKEVTRPRYMKRESYNKASLHPSKHFPPI